MGRHHALLRGGGGGIVGQTDIKSWSKLKIEN